MDTVEEIRTRRKAWQSHNLYRRTKGLEPLPEPDDLREFREAREADFASRRRTHGNPLASSNGSDPLVVNTDALATVVDSFIREHNQGIDDKDDTMSGIDYICHWAQIDQGQLLKLRKRQTQWTSYRVADRIVTAMDLNHIWGVHLHCVPNPRWTTERFARFQQEQLGCCDDD
jgi:hypothetical protein